MPKECCEQYPSAGTRRALLRVLRAALQHAVNEEELVSRNVGRQVKMPARDERRTREWTAEEAAGFLDEARKDRLYVLWAVALSLGLRRGEALGLRWATSILSAAGLTLLRRCTTSTARRSFCGPRPIRRRVGCRSLRRWLGFFVSASLSSGRTRWRPRAMCTGWCSPRSTARPLSPRNVNRAFERLCRRAGARRIRPARPAALVRHAAVRSGGGRGDRAADSSAQLDHGDDGYLHEGGRGGSSRCAGRDGSAVEG